MGRLLASFFPFRVVVVQFVWPAGWTPISEPPERMAAYRVTRAGNLEVALNLAREVTGRREATPPPEEEEAPAPPELPEELAELRVPARPPFQRFEPPLKELGMEPQKEKPAPPPRYEWRAMLIPAATVAAYREYLRRLPPARQTVRGYVFGAAWAIYLGEISAPTFGYFTQALQGGELAYLSPEVRTRQVAYRPAQVTEALLSDTRGGRFVPVTFYTVAALLRYTQGRSLRDPDFLHAIENLPWRVCGRIPRAGNDIFCPTRAPTPREREEMKPTAQVPLPTAEDLGEAPMPRGGQRTLE